MLSSLIFDIPQLRSKIKIGDDMQGIFFAILFLIINLLLLMSFIGIPLVPIYCFLVFYGADKRKAKADAKLSSALMLDEQILERAIQHRIFGLLSRRKLIAITNSRIILINRGLLGGFVMKDIQWKDLDDARLSENILSQYCGSCLDFDYTISNSKGLSQKGRINVDGIPTESAAIIYSKSQQEEHAWEEKRRVRDLEEKRAVSGGITFHGGMPVQNQPVAAGPMQTHVMNPIYAEIEKIKNLLDMGAISDSEFQEMKAKILAKN